MRKIISVALIVLTLLIIVSCEKEPVDPYMDYPLKGLTFTAPERDASVFEGTYIGADYASSLFGYDNHYWVSFRSNGTLTASPRKGAIAALNDDRVNGTWTLDGSTMTISVYGKTYIGTKYDVADAGFGVQKTSSDTVAFAKQCDYLTSAVTKSSLVGLWFKTDEYGRNFGYRFLADGTCYQYQTDGTTLKGTWVLSTNGTKILIGDGMGLNIALMGNYLAIGSGSLYQKAN